MVASKKKIFSIMLSLCIVVLNISCSFDTLKIKNETILSIKTNIVELENFIKEIKKNNNMSKNFSIERDLGTKIIYNSKLKDFIFEKFNLNSIYFDNDHNLISFYIESGWSSNSILFYYSEENNNYYYFHEKGRADEDTAKYIDVE